MTSSAAPPSAPVAGRHWWAIAGVLVALATVVYAPVHRYGFIGYDDPQNVAGEPHVHAGLTADGLRWAWRSVDLGPWMPLTRLSYLIDGQLFGATPAAMHVENVAWHAAAGVLLFGWLAEATGALGRSAAVAALFVAHPMHVESVAWITERRDVLSTALLMAATWAHVRHARTARPAAYGLALALYAASLLAKAMGMTFPVLLLLLDVWPLRRPASLWPKVPFAALAVPVAVLAAYGQRAAGAAVSLVQRPWGDRVANAVVTTVLYAVKLAWPTRLSVVYLPPAGGWSAAQVVAAAGVIGVAATLAVRCRRPAPYLAVGLSWFIVALSPVSGLAQAGMQSMADRYSYLPSVGLLVAGVWAAADVCRRLAPAVGAALGVAAVVTAAVTARVQVGCWRDTATLFAHADAVTDGNWFAEYHLGLDAATRGDLPAAAGWFDRSLAINPGFADAYDDLGNCYAAADPGRAADLYRRALAVRPHDARAAANLRALAAQRHRPPEDR